ncbi:MAG: L,D-transpeptidase [Rhodobacterales bacterium]|nr:L,D-transpeptidase [Rhodobacterales bacterium]NCT13408.1 L,D-transpeptidase [Rhodobacterales bacterium]
MFPLSRAILRVFLRFAVLVTLLGVAACARAPVEEPVQMIGGVLLSDIVEGYGPIEDAQYHLPPIPPEYLQGVNRRMRVVYNGDDAPGTIVVDPHAKFLFWIEEDGMAIRYPIAVGREGRGLRGETVIRRKVEWPGWTPTPNMLRREPELYEPYRGGVPGGLASPLGARALYLYRGNVDSFFRIHGTNDLGSIGNSGSAGCIRLFNHDVIDLFDRVPMGTRVRIRTYEESVRLEGEEMANRGVELPPVYIPPEELLGPLRSGPVVTEDLVQG